MSEQEQKNTPITYGVRVVKSRDNAPVIKAEHQTSLAQSETITAGDWITPTVEMRGLEALVSNSSILPQCIRAYKCNIAGFGIGVKYKDDIDETSEMAEEYTKAEAIIRRLNTEKDVTELFEDVLEAREIYGISYIEVIRTLKGEVCQIEFIDDIPSIQKTLPLDPYIETEYYDNGELVTKKKRYCKYKQQINGKTVYFREFGDNRRMDRRSGEYIGADGELDVEYEANEILEFAIGTKPYGTVRWIGQVLGIDGSRRAESLNNNYFINGRHTPMMIMVRGGTLTDDSFEKLQQYMDGIKGEAGQHAFVVLEVEDADSRADFDAKDKPDIEVKDMASILQKDELFQEYLDNNRRRTQSSFLLPDLYVGYTTDFNRATAQTAQEVTEQQVFQPERNSLAWIVNNKLLNCYNFKYVEVFFRAPNLNNPDDLTQLLSICNAAGGLTPNKAKSILYNALGETSEDYDGDWANEPLSRASAGEQSTDPVVNKQLDEQIEKAAAKHDDAVVAVMKEVRSLLKSFGNGLTNAPKRSIINADDDTKWITTANGQHLPLDDDGEIVQPSSEAKALSEAIKSGKVKTKLDKPAQSKHRQGTEKYNEAIKRGEHPSYLTINNMETQRVINEYTTKGTVRIGKDGQFRNTINCGKTIGMYVNKITGEETETTRATIHYSKEGTHLVPSYPKEE